ncbi:nucleotide triphosphate diphosphatase NUDT15 [Legionella bononiensis]|uniref:NUDIX domain-containing protein n=1 Tax=Legionella bononiensis TaxID=2793102 RepID=A0ABS1WDG7_9GAMM|nr:NUDIX hydrolase [Legionella bononiensis]MBL7481363.1 NUDIX domain-containing protein [Legionella bononiensis]MBL7527395.1 NUDIX domain-containing protein [Legionella bononiensis]
MNYPRVGIGVLIFNNNKLLLGQRLSEHGHLTWGPPGGHLELGETFEMCAIRETKEETGLIITSPKVFAITNDVFEKEHKHYVSIFLKAEYPRNQAIHNMEQNKVVSWQWFSLHSLPEPIFLPLEHLFDEGYFINNGQQFMRS